MITTTNNNSANQQRMGPRITPHPVTLGRMNERECDPGAHALSLKPLQLFFSKKVESMITTTNNNSANQHRMGPRITPHPVTLGRMNERECDPGAHALSLKPLQLFFSKKVESMITTTNNNSANQHRMGPRVALRLPEDDSGRVHW